MFFFFGVTPAFLYLYCHTFLVLFPGGNKFAFYSRFLLTRTVLPFREPAPLNYSPPPPIIPAPPPVAHNQLILCAVFRQEAGKFFQKVLSLCPLFCKTCAPSFLHVLLPLRNRAFFFPPSELFFFQQVACPPPPPPPPPLVVILSSPMALLLFSHRDRSVRLLRPIFFDITAIASPPLMIFLFFSGKPRDISLLFHHCGVTQALPIVFAPSE